MRNRDLHVHIKRRIEQELSGRSWSWLAEASGIPQSTLAGQASRPKFSLDALVRIASTLQKSPAYFLPGTDRASDAWQAEESARRIQSASGGPHGAARCVKPPLPGTG